MKIKGVEGYTPDTVRAEIDRGARFVMYTYCVSLLVVTFKRPSSIYLVRPGQSRLLAGLPWTLLSLVTGWWGFPWGPIYTLQSLIKNLRGGTDMTDEVMAAVAPPGPEPAAPQGMEGEAPPSPIAKKPLLSPIHKLLGSAGVGALLLIAYAAVCDQAGEHTLVLISGLPTRYTVELNGQAIELPPHGLVRLRKPEGEFTLKRSPGGGTETFRVSTPFWTRPFNPQVVLINPDRVAPIVQRAVADVSKTTVVTRDGDSVVRFYLNERVHIVPRPRFLFEGTPFIHGTPSDRPAKNGTALEALAELDLAKVFEIASTQLGDGGARRYVENLLAVRWDEEAVRFAVETLEPADALALLERRLGDRPVLVEVHRHHQQLSQRVHPDVDLVGRYTRWSDAEPQEGALLYLLGRVTTDEIEARALYQRALAAPLPSAFGHVGLGAGCYAVADFDDAARHYRLAEEAGIENQQVHRALHESWLALGRYDELLDDIRRRRLARRSDIELAGAEIRIEVLRGASPGLAKELIDAYCTHLAEGAEKEQAASRSFLEAQAAYALGDESTFARKIGEVPGSLFAFQSAVSRGECEAAAKTLAGQTAPVRFHLTIFLAAMRFGNTKAAEQAWKEALAAVPNDSDVYEDFRRFAGGDAFVHPESLCRSMLASEDKRVLLAALGLRFPRHRALFHGYAARFNASPDFPQLLVKSTLEQRGGPPTSTTR